MEANRMDRVSASTGYGGDATIINTSLLLPLDLFSSQQHDTSDPYPIILSLLSLYLPTMDKKVIEDKLTSFFTNNYISTMTILAGIDGKIPTTDDDDNIPFWKIIPVQGFFNMIFVVLEEGYSISANDSIEKLVYTYHVIKKKGTSYDDPQIVAVATSVSSKTSTSSNDVTKKAQPADQKSKPQNDECDCVDCCCALGAGAAFYG